MSRELEVTAETTITAKMSEARAGKIERSLGRMLASMDPEYRTQLVNTGSVDDLLSLRIALQNATGVRGEDRAAEGDHHGR